MGKEVMGKKENEMAQEKELSSRKPESVSRVDAD